MTRDHDHVLLGKLNIELTTLVEGSFRTDPSTILTETEMDGLVNREVSHSRRVLIVGLSKGERVIIAAIVSPSGVTYRNRLFELERKMTSLGCDQYALISEQGV